MNVVTTPSLLTCTDDHDFAGYKQHGYTAVWYQTWNSGGREYSSAAACQAAGLEVAAWGVIYDQKGFYSDGKSLAESANRLGAKYLMADVEDCLKGTRSTRAATEIIRGVRDGGWSGPVHLTTLGAPQQKPDGTFWDYEFDLDSFLETGGGIFPQAYANQAPTYAPKLCVDYFVGQLKVPRERLNLMIWLDDKMSANDWLALLEAAQTGVAFSVFLAEFFSGYGHPIGAFDKLRLTVTEPQAHTTPQSQQQPPPQLDPRLLQIRTNTLTEFKAAKASYDNWKTTNPGEAAKVDSYLGGIANGQTAQPPNLATHKGRGIIGVLLAGATTIGQPTPKLDARMQEIRVNTLAELKAAKASFTNWKTTNPGEAAKVEQYLAKIANGEKPQPPALATHRGRGIVGVLQAGAATIGQLP
jgi:hypothetical protein